MLALRSWFAVVAVLMTTACGEHTYTVEYAPSFSRNRRHISVFAIKRDGLLSPDGWAALGPEQPAPFDGTSCDVGYARGSLSARPSLEDSLQDYERDNGVTDELLTLLAPAAKGDTIMLVTIEGQVREPHESNASTRSATPAPASGGGRGGRRRGGGSGGGAGPARSNRSEPSAEPFTISATFYSIAEHRSVGLVELAYSGTRMDEALDQFRTKLEAEFPGSTCSGWDWSAPIDEAKITSLTEQ